MEEARRSVILGPDGTAADAERAIEVVGGPPAPPAEPPPLEFRIGVQKDGAVLVVFSAPITSMALAPVEARRFSRAMRQAAVAAEKVGQRARAAARKEFS